jgi:tetratricopeptide (TPR) repeat protein
MFGIAYYGRGLVYDNLKRYGKAISEYRLAVKNDLHPSVKISFNVFMNSGAIYMNQREFELSINEYSKAVNEKPNNGFAHYYLGLAYLRAGEYEKAEAENVEAKRLGITFTAIDEGLRKVTKGNKKNQEE